MLSVSWHDICYRWISSIICSTHSIFWEDNYWRVHLETNELFIPLTSVHVSLYTAQIRLLGKLYIHVMLPKYFKVLKECQRVDVIKTDSKLLPQKRIWFNWWSFFLSSFPCYYQTFLHFTSRHFHHWFHYYCHYLLADFLYFRFPPLRLLLQHFHALFIWLFQQSLLEYWI